jgi:hypothetical protein
MCKPFKGAAISASARPGPLHEILHIFIVVVIQTTHRDALAVALHFAAHPAVLTTIARSAGSCWNVASPSRPTPYIYAKTFPE